MCKSKSILRAIPAVVATVWLMLLPGEAAVAQSTLFNIPSTDVVSKKKVYLEFDFLSHFESHADGGFQVYAPRAVFGVAKGVEVGINVTGVDAFAPDQPVYVSPNVKWQFYNNEDKGVAISA